MAKIQDFRKALKKAKENKTTAEAVIRQQSAEQTLFRYMVMSARASAHGHKAAIKKRRLWAYVNAKQKETITERAFRRMFRRMQKAGYPIGSATCGYFVLKTAGDLELSINERQKKARALTQSIAWDRKAYANKVQRVLNLYGARGGAAHRQGATA